MAAERIDFEAMLPGYNKRNGTKFKTVDFMLRHCYRKQAGVKNAAGYLGVAYNTFLSGLRSCGINFRSHKSKYHDRYMSLPLEKMRCSDVAAALGCHVDTVRQLAKTTGKQYARGKK